VPAERTWLAPQSQEVVQSVLAKYITLDPSGIQNEIEALAKESHKIHDIDSIT
jgi:hypothetical protein